MPIRLYNNQTFKILRRGLRNGPTTVERTLWKNIKNSQLGHKFRRQQGIGPYIVDFYCPEKSIIVELDGWIHGEEGHEEKDQKRQVFLEQQGFTVVRYRNEQIKYELSSVLHDLKRRCDGGLGSHHPCLSASADKGPSSGRRGISRSGIYPYHVS